MHTLNSPQPTLNTPLSTYSPSDFYDPSMANLFLLLLSLIVIGSTGGILIWFFRRLKRIEDELWGSKRAEAAETALAVAEEEDEAKAHADDTTEP